MTEFEIELPPGWSEHSEESQRRSTVAKYQYTTAADTRFVVSLLKHPSNTDGYKLRLSTIIPLPTHVRHDYPVEEYDTRADAFEGVESFLEHISVQLHDGSVSHDEPRIEEIRGMIQDFTDTCLLSSIRQLVCRRYR